MKLTDEQRDLLSWFADREVGAISAKDLESLQLLARWVLDADEEQGATDER